MIFAHPYNTDRTYKSVYGSQVSPYVLCGYTPVNLLSEISDPIGAKIYTSKDRRNGGDVLLLEVSFKQFINYLNNRYNKLNKVIEWFKQEKIDTEEKWKKEKVTLKSNPIETLLNIIKVLDDRLMNNYGINQIYFYLNCRVTNSINEKAINIYRKKIIESIPFLIDAVNSLDEDEINDILYNLTKSPDRVKGEHYYQLEKIYSYLDESDDVIKPVESSNEEYSMLNIQFKSANVEKNYYSQFMEFVDKYKAKYTKELHELSEGFEIELGIDVNTFYGQKGVCMWSRYGYGKNIKEAEQDAARNLFSLLEEYGLFDMNNVLPKRNYNLETAVNFLQELSQKGYIGEITYEDEACFTTERKPYWRVKCSIANYVVSFFGCDESKKKAKKKAAIDALIFIYENYNKKDANPQNKVFKFVLNQTIDSDEMKVIVINSINDIIAKGTVYPDNKEYDLYLTSDYVDMEDDYKWKAYDNPEEFLLEWIANNPRISDNLLDGSEISFYVHNEYTKLPEEVKNNGVLLREAFLNIANKYLEK